jgi:XTP/dITP diphosphohydrolase
VPPTILIATTNAGKLREIHRILAGVPVAVTTLADFPGVPIADETGATFADNARQKALHYSGATGMATLAEDSGFEIDALNGEPGVYSARYLSETATYPERFDDILRRLRKLGTTNRAARFVCALSFARHPEIVFETIASVDGLVADAAAGTNGFGYDPLFFYPPFGKTFGEVSDAEKTAVSHRGQAMRVFRAYLLG